MFSFLFILLISLLCLFIGLLLMIKYSGNSNYTENAPKPALFAFGFFMCVISPFSGIILVDLLTQIFFK